MNLKDLFDNKENWKLIPETTGVYTIHNKITDGVYIGSASGKKGFRRRLHSHFRHLIKNTHCNQYLQNAFNKYGIESFSFNIVELCAAENCTKYEQSWLDFKFGNNCYNICPSAISFYVPIKQSTIDLLSKEFIVIFPNGAKQRLKNIKKFCRDNKLDEATVHKVIKGKQHQHKGFNFYPVIEEELLIKQSNTNKLSYKQTNRMAKVFDPNGHIYMIESNKIAEFERQHNFTRSSIATCCKLNKYQDTYKNWSGYYCDDNGIILEEVALNRLKVLSSRYKSDVFKELDKPLYKITTNTNTELYTKNIKMFCKTHDCNYISVIECINKKQKTFNNGWTIKVDE